MGLTTKIDAGLDDVFFTSRGSMLLGGFYRGGGSGLRPTAILLHGVPGVETNMDVAYALREQGWNCLYFHYRGCWGSEGNYSFQGAEDDVSAATEWVLTQPSVDPKRLAIVGNSFGGYLALAATATDLRYRATVSMCPLVDPASAAFDVELFDEFAGMLTGVTGAELKAQWDALPSIHTMQADLNLRPILLITADSDELFPPSHYESLVNELGELIWERIADADHVFSSARRQLVDMTVNWLQDMLGS
jgi:dipeptidyl aminopeptidase/acylaminoacyl peptidase